MSGFETIFKYSKPGMYEEAGIDFFVNIPKVSSDIIIFTLYGQVVDKLIMDSITSRAIDQKKLADETTKRVFHLLFKKEVLIEYNLYPMIKKKDTVANLRYLFKTYSELHKTIDDLIVEFENKKDDIIRAEIDGKIIFEGIEKDGDYVEMKLYTCPERNLLGPLRKHFTTKSLARHFALNRYLALMGFSYIKDPSLNIPSDIPSDNPTDSPLPYGDGGYPYGLRSVWAINISFLNSNILKIKAKSRKRSGWILDGAKLNLDRLTEKLGLRPKGLFFKNTVNLVKVHQMGQVIESYKQKNKQLNDSLEKRDKKIEAMGQKIEVIEQEKNAMGQKIEVIEQEKNAMGQKIEVIEQENERYRRLLIEHGIIKEDLPT